MLRLILLACLLPVAMFMPWSIGDARAQRRGIDATQPLANGRYRWEADPGPATGPLSIIVSLARQQLFVYRNGVLIGQSTISSGDRGHQTPLGAFTILQKSQWHRSNLYSAAPMPFMQRLTWDGIALHAGDLPGYPASHGCIRLPRAFAQRLFGMSSLGASVTVLHQFGAPPVYLPVADLDWMIADGTGVAGGATPPPLTPRAPARRGLFGRRSGSD